MIEITLFEKPAKTFS